MKDRHDYRPAVPQGKHSVKTLDHLPKEQINHTMEDFLRRQMMVTALTHAKSGPIEIVGYILSVKIQLLVGIWFYCLDEA